MKQEEKNQQSRERILNAAVLEFGTYGYEGTSLNTLLSEHGISKGLFYHYFENKDLLYLACTESCFQALTQRLAEMDAGIGAEDGLQEYFQIRGRFFREFPSYERIFFEVLLQPPVRLQESLKKVRSEFEALNRRLFRSVLSGLRLRKGLTEENALEYFTLMQSALHLRFLTGREEKREGANRYEEEARRAVTILLYGLVRREGQ